MNLDRSNYYNNPYYPYLNPSYQYPYPYYPYYSNFLATSLDSKKIDKNSPAYDKNKKTINFLKAVAVNTTTIFTQSQIDEIIAYVNNYRSLHESPPLIWDTTIATYSQNWANYLLKNNLFHHSGSQLYGENLAYFEGYGTDMMALIKLAIDTWYNEIKLYDFNNPGFSEETGHFTALVWKSTTTCAFGFAIDPITDSVDITMNLSPPGNVIGHFDENVIKPVNPIVIPITAPIPSIVQPTPLNPLVIIPPISTNSTPSTVPPIPMNPNHVNPNPMNPSNENTISSTSTTNSNTELKAEIIHSLYNIITLLYKNKSKDVIINDINNIIVDIVNI
jgi:hypothetical protein